jgi:trehalose-6-phosphate synthase
MEGSDNPIVFVQDYHFALVPRLIKAARPDARVAIFWHIPWPNPEAFGICPWQAKLLEGLLGADLIGFHIPLHCNNFLSTVDRVLESRTDREHMTARRDGHTTDRASLSGQRGPGWQQARTEDAEYLARGVAEGVRTCTAKP